MVLIAATSAISLINFSAEGCNASEVFKIKGKKFSLLSFASFEYLVFFKWYLAFDALKSFLALLIDKFTILPFCIPINGDTKVNLKVNCFHILKFEDYVWKYQVVFVVGIQFYKTICFFNSIFKSTKSK